MDVRGWAGSCSCSGCAAPLRVDSPAEAAALVRAGLQLRLGSGALIGARLARSGQGFVG